MCIRDRYISAKIKAEIEKLKKFVESREDETAKALKG